jgi:hypothetical protein
VYALAPPGLEVVEKAARQAATARLAGSTPRSASPDPPILTAQSELDGVAAVLRHRLQLDDSIRLSAYTDAVHPLFPGARHFRAARVQLSYGRRGYFFVAAYERDSARLTFSLVAPCRSCSAHVPTAVIDDLADFGLWLLHGPGGVIEAPQFRTSPIHRRSCPVRR